MLIVTYFISLIPEYSSDERKDIRPATTINNSTIEDTLWDAGKTTVV